MSLNADSKSELLEEEPTISLDLQDANLKDLLKIFSIQSGLNFIASEGVQDRKITLYLDQVPLKKAMDKLFKANNLAYELEKDANIFIVKDLGKLQIETLTKVFYLKYASVSSSSLRQEMGNIISCGAASSAGGSGRLQAESEVGITNAVKKLLSDAGSVIEDFRTNSLIVTDTPMRMEVISQVIASLDVPAPQVLLEVEMLDVSKDAVDQLGVNWPTSLLSLDVTGARITNFPFFGNKANKQAFTFDELTTPSGNWTIGAGAAGSHFIPSVFSVINANLTLDFFRSQSDTKFLARPRILTLNNETAEIRIATNESIGIKQTSSGPSGGIATSSVEAERTETGVILRVTPQINTQTGEITMVIYPKVAEAVAGSQFIADDNIFQFRDPEERSTKSVVRVKDGETVVLGGLIRQEITRQETKLPFFGDIPIIGFFFRHTGGTSSNPDKNRERELLVFITPHIIKDLDMRLAQKQEITPPEREQNTLSGGSRESQINATLNSFDKKKR
jgi:type IV pilus assembly protein PilQ